jgi:ferritin
MDPKFLQQLNEQATHELTAAYAYLAMANWCASEDYSGFASFFRKQAEEEREHSAKIQEFLLDRGELPVLGALAAPKLTYASLQDVALTALSLEKANTLGIEKAYELAESVKDHASKSMLLWFLSEQVEEEAWAQSMVTQTSRVTCPGAVLDLDRHIVKMLSGD